MTDSTTERKGDSGLKCNTSTCYMTVSFSYPPATLNHTTDVEV